VLGRNAWVKQSMLGLLLLAFGIYDYNASAPLDIKVTKVEKRQGVEVRDITYSVPPTPVKLHIW
jgi:hypothetical protein